MQVLNVGGLRFGDTPLILSTAKFCSTPIFLAIAMVVEQIQFAQPDPSLQNQRFTLIEAHFSLSRF